MHSLHTQCAVEQYVCYKSLRFTKVLARVEKKIERRQNWWTIAYPRLHAVKVIKPQNALELYIRSLRLLKSAENNTLAACGCSVAIIAAVSNPPPLLVVRSPSCYWVIVVMDRSGRKNALTQPESSFCEVKYQFTLLSHPPHAHPNPPNKSIHI